MTTAAGRATVSYLLRCALPSGRSITKRDQYGVAYTFSGALGLAPGWETAGATADDKYWVSSCMLAHINTTGQHIAIHLDGLPPVGWGRDAAFPIQEGTFIGDIFASPPVARYCGGRGFGSNVVAGRIGDKGQSGQPYSVITASNGSTRCDASCSRDPSGDGFTYCSPIAGKAITIWRQFDKSPALSFESGISGFTAQTPGTLSLTSTTAKAIHGTHSLLVTMVAPGPGNDSMWAPAPAGLIPGQNMTVFVNMPSTQGWSYIQAYAQDGPAKNYRWTSSGYQAASVVAGDWNSIVVPIPADFAVTGSKIGLVISAATAATIKVYVDAIFFGS
jgi:hypothetical protein